MRKCRVSPNSKEEGAIKSLTDRPLAGSQFHSKANCPPSGWRRPCSSASRSLPSSALAPAPITVKRFRVSASIRGKPCPRCRKIFRLDGQRDIFALHKAVVAALILHLQDTGRLHAHIVQRVALGVHTEQVSVLILMAAAQGHLHADGGIIAVIEIAEAFKDIPLVVRPRQTVVDVLIGYGLGEKPVVQPAQAVRVQVRNGMLSCTVWGLPSPFACWMMASICFRSARVSLRFAAGCEFSGFAVLFSNRPYLLFQFCLPHPGRNRRCWSDRCAASDG